MPNNMSFLFFKLSLFGNSSTNFLANVSPIFSNLTENPLGNYFVLYD